ncbi:MAG: hypothetical protein M3024_09290 [Candidatus Dormibacteraeota bacterium]|nr:hypothetical protein [Candidatus Dormibacteraeota bacterium]
MRLNPRLVLAGAGVTALLGLAGAGAVLAGTALAASPSPTANPTCDSFLGHVASDLGKTKSQVQQAVAQARGQTLDDLVKQGKLTQAQADKLKAAASTGSCGLGGRFGPGPRGGRFGNLLADEATALGISTSQLQSDLKSGQTVAQVAAAKGLDEQQFRTKFVAAVKVDLDARVKSGLVTQAQENAVLGRLQTTTPPYWNGGVGGGSVLDQRHCPAGAARAADELQRQDRQHGPGRGQIA